VWVGVGVSVHLDWKQDLSFGESTNKQRAIITVSDSNSECESGEPDHRPPLLWHTEHRNAFSGEDKSPGARVWAWHSHSQHTVPCLARLYTDSNSV
jgi:hypothetical protein